MNPERLTKVLLAPHVSEKSTNAGEQHNQYVFRVTRDAKKPEVKKAVEQLFSVKVSRVQILNMKGKAKRFGVVQGRRNDWKKAYVTLESGQEIDFLGGE